jgi:hypothetical protein
MAKMKKAAVKKAAPKKMVKRPASKKQAPQEAPAPVPTQQNPQPPMGTPPVGGNGPMMRKGGKIKKAQGGGPVKDTTKTSYETSPFIKAKQEKENKKTEYKKFTTTMKKAQGGVVVPKKNEKEEFTYLRNSEKAAATKSLATKTTKKAQSGTKFGMLSVKAGVDNNPKPTAADRIVGAKGLAKGGKTMKKCKYGCK